MIIQAQEGKKSGNDFLKVRVDWSWAERLVKDEIAVDVDKEVSESDACFVTAFTKFC